MRTRITAHGRQISADRIVYLALHCSVWLFEHCSELLMGSVAQPQCAMVTLFFSLLALLQALLSEVIIGLISLAFPLSLILISLFSLQYLFGSAQTHA